MHLQTNLETEGWILIKTYEDWNKIDDYFLGFRDGVIKDLHWSHGEYVDESLNMIYTDSPNVWLLIQFQTEDYSSIEFLLTGVEELNINVKHELVISINLNKTIVLNLSEKSSLKLSELSESRISAEKLFYRIPNPPLLGAGRFNYF